MTYYRLFPNDLDYAEACEELHKAQVPQLPHPDRFFHAGKLTQQQIQKLKANFTIEERDEVKEWEDARVLGLNLSQRREFRAEETGSPIITAPSGECTASLIEPNPLYPLWADIATKLREILAPGVHLAGGNSLAASSCPYVLHALWWGFHCDIARSLHNTVGVSSEEKADLFATLRDCEQRLSTSMEDQREPSHKATLARDVVLDYIEDLGTLSDIAGAKRELNIALLNADAEVRRIYSQRLTTRISEAEGFADWVILGKIDRVIA
jgi:hypothetical protein